MLELIIERENLMRRLWSMEGEERTTARRRIQAIDRTYADTLRHKPF